MNLYLISQNERASYDTYDSAVVVAFSEMEAATIHPYLGIYNPDEKLEYKRWEHAYSGWASHPDYVEVQLIGKADSRYTEPQVICGSFNAG